MNTAPVPVSTPESETILRVAGLTKRFGELVAVDSLTLDVRRGEILGFLGPNGAGKTTSLRMMCGLLRSDGGTVELDGRALVATNDVLPTTLCVRAFNRILNFGAGVGDVVFELVVILALTVVYFAVGSWLFSRRHQRV